VLWSGSWYDTDLNFESSCGTRLGKILFYGISSANNADCRYFVAPYSSIRNFSLSYCRQPALAAAARKQFYQANAGITLGPSAA
jgi:hypothetical protein